MSFLDDQYNSVRQNQEQYLNNYESQSYFLSRKLLFSHGLSYLNHIKNQINVSTNLSKNLTIHNLKQIRSEDTSEQLSYQFSIRFLQLLNTLKEKRQLNKDDIFWLVTSTFKTDVIMCIVYYGVGMIVQLLQLLIMLSIFKSVANYEMKSAFIYVAIYIFILYIIHLCWQNANMYIVMLVAKVKSSLVRIQYAKISKMTTYSINKMDKGMLINLIASGIGSCQENLVFLFYSLLLPINIIGYTFFLVKLLGWPGLVGIFLTIIFVPLLKKLSEVNNELFQDLSKEKDKRIEVTTQTIEGMKYIKLYTWESVFQKRIEEHRRIEIGLLRKYALVLSVERAIACAIGNFASFFMYFLSYYYNTGLTLPKILSTLHAITILDYAFISIPLALSVWSQIDVVFQRFATFFNFENTQMIKIDEKNQPSKSLIDNSLSPNKQQLDYGQIIFENFTSYWGQDFNSPTLLNINLHFKKGKMYGITGKVGAGKSTMLAAILSEMPYYSGNISHKGSIAYVEQEPVVFSDTVKNNIIFGATFQKNRYVRAIQLSCLINDISTFEKGEQTILGEKGTTLSGGQKIRLSLARALYTNADIYLLDDPISGVDPKVAKNIHSNIVQHLAKQKTVILVTHQINYLYNCDEVIVLKQGKVAAKGTPTQLKSILNELNQSKETSNEGTKSLKQIEPSSKMQSETPIIQRQIKKDEYIQQKNEHVQNSNRFADKEVAVNFGTYINFFKSNKWNYILLPLTILLFICSQVILILNYIVLSKYESVKLGTEFYFGSNFNLFWTISILLISTNLFIGILKCFFLNMCILNSSQKIHKMMVRSVIRSPMKFFDVTPSGALTNKFTNDLGVIDNNLFYSLTLFLQGPTSTIVTLVSICLLDFSLTIFMIPLTIAIIWFFLYYKQVLLVCKQFFLQNKNELVHFFKQNMAGMTQIRILGRRKTKLREVSGILNKELKANFGYQITSTGFSFYICLILIAFVSVTLFYLIYFTAPEKLANFGLCVAYLTYITEMTYFYLGQLIATDGQMVSAQRLLDFSLLESQKGLQTDFSTVEPKAQLQKAGFASLEDIKIELKDYSGRYRRDLPLSLKDINLCIQKGQRIGIVGRTGAGKSSIIQALFRILEPQLGSIYKIGGENALEMGLHSLRKRFGMIPQTPFIFKGSIRYNIDPQGFLSDDEIWTALNIAGLSEYIKNLPNQLQTQISSSSQSFSMGQKQLLSLARVLLFRKNFLVMDEATSNVDMKTDAFMQKAIRQQFKDTTIITVAHRLNTVADYDRIIVMHEGRLIEEGSYEELVSKRGSFYEMVEHSRKNSKNEK